MDRYAIVLRRLAFAEIFCGSLNRASQRLHLRNRTHAVAYAIRTGAI
jgi:hypothetical protein